MGTRHLYGLGELAKTPFDNVDLVAVCDIRRDNAELAAAEAEKLVGRRPAVFTDLETMHREVADLMAVDVVVDPSVHHAVVCQALDLGLHVMVEKPMAITIKGCQQMIEAAKRNKRILSVAENYRATPRRGWCITCWNKGPLAAPTWPSSTRWPRTAKCLSRLGGT